jgi:hypothetical protein
MYNNILRLITNLTIHYFKHLQFLTVAFLHHVYFENLEFVPILVNHGFSSSAISQPITARKHHIRDRL